MSCLIISMLSYTSGRAMADEVASRLGYDLVEEAVFQEASAASGISELTLMRVLSEAPSLFGPSMRVRRKAVAHVGAALAKRLLKDRVVYTGPFGHLLISGISHVVRVRVVAEWPDRVAVKAKREGLEAVEAETALLRRDRGRARLVRRVFGVDEEDPSLFDVLVNTSEVSVEGAVELVVKVLARDRYRPMTYSMRCMEDLELALRARACLVDLDPNVEAEAEAGNVSVRSRVGGVFWNKKLAEMRRRVMALEGVKSIAVHAVEDKMGQKWGPA